ncbi:MAG: thymidylate synthase, partial [Chloroflexi bacterium]|nr:thymidylate synthase [Chloroflexota bacterium]
MPYPFFSELTLDDLLREVVQDILAHGEQVEHSTKGANLERRAVLLELRNPRARLSRTETRGHIFSALGEFCWYLSGRNDSEFITYYIARYRKFDEGGVIWGGYGPRLFDREGRNQVADLISLLQKRPASRRAALQIYDARDLAGDHKDVPCT